MTILNLRGVRESGLIFIVPTIAFVVCMSISIVMGFIRVWQGGGYPHPVIAPPVIPLATATLSVWLLLSAFANGLTAMTGVEAVSNAIPLFRKPTVKNARWTLTVIVGILGLFLLALGYLCPAYHISAMEEISLDIKRYYLNLLQPLWGRAYFIISPSLVFLSYLHAQRKPALQIFQGYAVC